MRCIRSWASNGAFWSMAVKRCKRCAHAAVCLVTTVTATKRSSNRHARKRTMAGRPPAFALVPSAPFHDSPLCRHAAAPQHGGDSAGLVCGYLMQGSTPAMPLDSTEAAHWLHAHGNPTVQGGQPHQCAAPSVWLHFNLAHAQALRWIQRHAQRPMRF